MTPLRFVACTNCSRSIPAEMTLCFDCIAQDEPAQRDVLPAPTSLPVPPPIPAPDAVTSAVTAWAQDQYEIEVQHWQARVKSVRWQSFFLFLPCFALFLAFRSWPFVALVVAVNFLGWRRIRHAESLRPVKPPFG